MMQKKEGGSIIYFDGVCLLCNRFVAFVLKHDKCDRYRFSTIQKLEKTEGVSQIDSILFKDHGQFYQESEAVIRIVSGFGGVWPIVKILRIVPICIRDKVYRWIAKNRFRLFGKTVYCSVMTPDIKHKFLA